MTIQLQRESSRPLYLQVADQLRLKIESGELTPNTRLPASRVLAKQLGVNRITIVNAYAEIEAEGLVMSRIGSGTFVAPVPGNLAPAEVEPPRPWRGLMPLRRQWNANQMLAEMMRLARQPGVISFAGGGPASEFLPVNEFRRALNETLRRDGADALQYQEAAGYHPLKEIIANNLKQQNIPIKAEDILITTGCQQALDIVLRVLVPGETGVVLVEDPCYLGLLDLVSAQRVTPVGIPLDEHGLRIEQLESMILRHRPQLIYVTPTFQNPTGVTMTLERRQRLLTLANRYGIPILEDTIYDELRYEGQIQPTLKSLDRTDIVLQASSFSKILLPGIRIGYLVVPAILHDRLLAAKQTVDISTSPLNQRALHAYLQSGHFSQHLQQVRRAYKIRLDAMLAAIEQHFPQEACWRVPQGGMYIWVEMPADGPTATNLYLMAINYNVAFAIGSVFSASGSSAHAMRLNFTNRSPHEIEEGIRRLGKAWKELLARRTEATSHPAQRTTMHIL